jgi:hypothetical protein
MNGHTIKIVAFIKQRTGARHGRIFYLKAKKAVVLTWLLIQLIQILYMLHSGVEQEKDGVIQCLKMVIMSIKQLMAAKTWKKIVNGLPDTKNTGGSA